MMRAGFIQFKPAFGEVEANIRKIESLTGQADADLLVLPELCNTGYLFTSRREAEEMGEEIPEGKTTRSLCRLARAKNNYIVAGIVEREGSLLFNASVLVGPRGHIATYRKIHLFSEENLWFDPGDREFAVHDIGICRVGLMICFDWLFPEAARVLALKGADVLCHAANLVLPFCQNAMVTRCLENRVYAITANRTGTEIRSNRSLSFTGRSQITGPDGSILSLAGEDSEEMGIVDLDIGQSRKKGINPYNDVFGSRRAEYYAELTNRRQQ